MKNQKDRAGRATRLVSTWRFGKYGVLGEGMEALSSLPCLALHPIHRAVSDLYPFEQTGGLVSRMFLESGESL